MWDPGRGFRVRGLVFRFRVSGSGFRFQFWSFSVWGFQNIFTCAHFSVSALCHIGTLALRSGDGTVRGSGGPGEGGRRLGRQLLGAVVICFHSCFVSFFVFSCFHISSRQHSVLVELRFGHTSASFGQSHKWQGKAWIWKVVRPNLVLAKSGQAMVGEANVRQPSFTLGSWCHSHPTERANLSTPKSRQPRTLDAHAWSDPTDSLGQTLLQMPVASACAFSSRKKKRANSVFDH